MIMWGLNVIAVKIVVEYFSPIMMTAFRIMLAALVVLIFLLISKELRLPKKREWFYLLMAALTGVFGHQFFLAIGLTNTTASNTGLILGTVPLATSILAVIMLGDRLSFLRIVGILFGLTGVSVVVLSGNTGKLIMSIGDIYIFLAVITQALSFIYIKKAAKTLSSRFITGTILLIGSLFLFVLALIVEPDGFSKLLQGETLAWAVFLASGIFATGLGHFLYNHAIQHIGPGQTSIFINMTPFFALLGSFLFLDEKITFLHLFGFLFIVISVLLGSGLAEQYLYRKIQIHRTFDR